VIGEEYSCSTEGEEGVGGDVVTVEEETEIVCETKVTSETEIEIGYEKK
jgi:hypothetical protein